MGKRWKCLSALGLAVLLGCMLPMSTMMAAEEIESISENSIEVNDEQETEQISADAEGETEQASADAEEETEQVSADAEGETEQISADIGQQTNQVYEVTGESGAPVIRIMFQGQNQARSLDGAIAYNVYVGSRDQCLSISVDAGDNTVLLGFYLDENAGDESKNEEELASLWQETGQNTSQDVTLKQDGRHVLYAKAVADGQTVYARTDGIVVDTIPPVITGIKDGGSYPAGTKFGVTDANLYTVSVNESPVAPDEDGLYSVAPNGLSTSCIIRAKDRAEHETVYNITVTDEGEKPDEDDKPEDDITDITKSGTYSLHADTAYRLGSGKWTIDGDRTVYRGGITFYVNIDGDYQFKKR